MLFDVTKTALVTKTAHHSWPCINVLLWHNRALLHLLAVHLFIALLEYYQRKRSGFSGPTCPSLLNGLCVRTHVRVGVAQAAAEGGSASDSNAATAAGNAAAGNAAAGNADAGNAADGKRKAEAEAETIPGAHKESRI